MINFQTHDNGWRTARRRMKNWRDEFEFTALRWLLDDDVVDDFSFVADVYWDVKFKHK